MRKWFGGGGSEDSDDSPGTFGNLALDRVLPQARGPLIRENIATVPHLLGWPKARIRDRIRKDASPRHVPDDIVQVPEIPRTLTGKKMELPVRKLLLGAQPEAVASPDAMANPGSFATYVAYAQRLATVA